MGRKIARLTSAILVLIMCLALLWGCGAKQEVAAEVDKPAVLAESQVEEAPQAEPIVEEPGTEPIPEEPAAEAEAPRVFADFRFSEPAQFTADPENPMRMLAPKDKSYIEVSLLPSDKTILGNDKASYTKYLTDAYTEALGATADVFIDSFAVKKIDGADGIRAMYFVETGSFWAYILEVTVALDEYNIRVVFADTTKDNKWMDAFIVSAKTIDIVWSDEVDGPDYSQYQLCDNGTGLTVRLATDMKYKKTEGMTMFYSSDTCMMSGIRETFEEYEAAGVDAAAMSMEDYAALIQQSNGLQEAFTLDANGNYVVTYTRDVGGKDFFYYTTLRKGAEAFWVVSFACVEQDRDAFMPEFELWANSIVVE